MERTINFDMDGTIANLYGVDNWLDHLINGSAKPYAVASPLLNLSVLARYIHKAQKNGYEVNIISWLAKGSNAEYDEKVAAAKYEWLNKHLPSVKFNNIYIIPYGTPKSLFGSGILFDDEEQNRIEWKGKAYSEKEIIEVFKNLF